MVSIFDQGNEIALTKEIGRQIEDIFNTHRREGNRWLGEIPLFTLLLTALKAGLGQSLISRTVTGLAVMQEDKVMKTSARGETVLMYFILAGFEVRLWLNDVVK